jgi:hypothetical protein
LLVDALLDGAAVLLGFTVGVDEVEWTADGAALGLDVEVTGVIR